MAEDVVEQAVTAARRQGSRTPVVTATCALIAAGVMAGTALDPWLDIDGQALILLAAILIGANRFGLTTGIAAALAGFLALNFFFIPPRFTFTVGDPKQLVTLAVFLLVAVLTGSLAGRMREASAAARQRLATLQAVYAFSGRLADAGGSDDVVLALVRQLAEISRSSAVVLMPSAEQQNVELSVRSMSPDGRALDLPDWESARAVWRRSQPAPAAAAGWPGARFEFHPIIGAQGIVGVAGFDSQGRGIDQPQLAAVNAVLRQAGVAFDRLRLARAAAEADRAAQEERLRSSLLASVSHDLRTPLAAITGAVTSLRRFGKDLPAAAEAELLATIEDEADRLSRHVRNLLDMTRLQSGTIDARRDWIDVGDAVRAAIARVRRAFAGLSVSLQAEAGLAPIRGDALLLEQAIFNLLENAAKFAGTSQSIAVRLVAGPAIQQLTITDTGPGIPPDQLEAIFEKFVRLDTGDKAASGTGLGLTIARGIITAMGGTLTAASPLAEGRGTRMSIELPAAPMLATVAPANAAVQT